MFNIMKNFKGKFVVFTLVCLLSLLIGVVEAEEYTLKVGHNAASDSYTDKGCQKMKQVAADLTDGNLNIIIYPANELGGNNQMIESTSLGIQDMCILGLGTMAYMDNRYAFLQMPYLFQSQEHLHSFVEGEYAQQMAEELRKEDNLRLLSQTWDRMPRQIAGTKPIKTPNDAKDLLLRGGTQSIVKYYKLLGAQTTHIDLNEMYLALQQGVLQAAELPIDYFYNYSIYEVADYLSLVNHVYGDQYVAINERSWDELPEEYQEALIKAVNEGKKVNNEIVWGEQDKYIDMLKDEGMKVISAEEVEYSEFNKKLKDLLPEIYDIWPTTEGMYEIIMEYVK